MRIIRPKDLAEIVGLRATQIAVSIEEDEFPKPILLRDGGRAIGWLEDEIADWQAYRRAKRDKAFKGNYQQWLESNRPSQRREMQ